MTDDLHRSMLSLADILSTQDPFADCSSDDHVILYQAAVSASEAYSTAGDVERALVNALAGLGDDCRGDQFSDRRDTLDSVRRCVENLIGRPLRGAK